MRSHRQSHRLHQGRKRHPLPDIHCRRRSHHLCRHRNSNRH